MSEGETAAPPPSGAAVVAPDQNGHEPTAAEQRWVEGLQREIAEHRPSALPALLTATALLRVAAVATGVAVQFDLNDLAGGRPNALAIGLVGASQALTEMLFAPLLARLADRFGRSRFLVGGPLLGFAAVLVVALGTTPAQLAGARLVEGVGAAAFTPTALALIAASTVGQRSVRVRASGFFEAATLAGYAGGFLLGPFTWVALHRAAFLAIGALYGGAALVCLRFVPRVPPLRVSAMGDVVRTVLGPGPMRAFLPAWLCGFALLGAFLANLAALLRHQRVGGQTLMHHFDERLIGAFLVLWVALFLLGILLWTPYLQRHRPVAVMRRAIPGVWLIVPALLAINHTPLAWAPLFLPLLALGIVWLAGFGPAAVTYLADCSEALAADRAALMSFYTVSLAGGTAVGAVLGGIATRLFQADGLLGLGLLLSVVTFGLLAVVARHDLVASHPSRH